MALLILALLQRIFLMSSLMLLLVWLIFFMVLIKLLPILGTISGKTVKLMVLALMCLGNNRQDFTLALVRFPPTATKEIQYLNAEGALTYTDIAGDPVLYGNLPPREISMKDVFRSGDSSKKFKIAEGQWYRYAPSYVSPASHFLEV